MRPHATLCDYTSQVNSVDAATGWDILPASSACLVTGYVDSTSAAAQLQWCRFAIADGTNYLLVASV